jgi:hypothetical protein
MGGFYHTVTRGIMASIPCTMLCSMQQAAVLPTLPGVVIGHRHRLLGFFQAVSADRVLVVYVLCLAGCCRLVRYFILFSIIYITHSAQ